MFLEKLDYFDGRSSFAWDRFGSKNLPSNEFPPVKLEKPESMISNLGEDIRSASEIGLDPEHKYIESGGVSILENREGYLTIGPRSFVNTAMKAREILDTYYPSSTLTSMHIVAGTTLGNNSIVTTPDTPTYTNQLLEQVGIMNLLKKSKYTIYLNKPMLGIFPDIEQPVFFCWNDTRETETIRLWNMVGHIVNDATHVKQERQGVNVHARTSEAVALNNQIFVMNILAFLPEFWNLEDGDWSKYARPYYDHGSYLWFLQSLSDSYSGGGNGHHEILEKSLGRNYVQQQGDLWKDELKSQYGAESG